jgi:threonine/homoserine/homoserine lactone efflux protein
MQTETIAVFAGSFLLLAATPGAGLAMILSRTLGAGRASGFAVVTGLVLGDFVFMGLAMLGLSAAASALGPWFAVIKYAAAAYLVWLGWRYLTAPAPTITLSSHTPRGLWRDVASGLLVTMGNPKPLLFYGALLPSFLDMTRVGLADYATLAGIVVCISYPVCGAYIVAAHRARQVLLNSRAAKRLNQASGAMFIGSGLWVAAR